MLACRVESTRLYAKPLQRIGDEITILDQILNSIRAIPVIDAGVLGVSSLRGNEPFAEIAERHGAGHVVGEPEDVLGRLIQGAESAKATDVFVVTSENPFLGYEFVGTVWTHHLTHLNDVTVLEGVPDGMGFEIYQLEALRKSHQNANPAQREHASRYIKQNLADFSVGIFDVDSSLQRPDLRFTVDHPEDLVFCRAAYKSLRDKAPLIPMNELIDFADGHPELFALIAPFHDQSLPWRPETAKR